MRNLLPAVVLLMLFAVTGCTITLQIEQKPNLDNQTLVVFGDKSLEAQATQGFDTSEMTTISVRHAQAAVNLAVHTNSTYHCVGPNGYVWRILVEKGINPFESLWALPREVNGCQSGVIFVGVETGQYDMVIR